MDYSDPWFLATFFVAASVIAYAYRKAKIDRSAVLASAVVGIGVLFLLLDHWYLIYSVVMFFAAGNLITRYRRSVKERYNVAEGVRSYKNVFGNGGAAVLFSLAYFFTNDPLMLFGVVGSMAAATADTFATEVGQAHDKKPRLITSLKKVEVGTSGAISLYGLTGAFLGSALTSSVPLLFGFDYQILLICAFSGFLGCVIDSLIGATLENGAVDTHVTNFMATSAGGFIALFLAANISFFI